MNQLRYRTLLIGTGLILAVPFIAIGQNGREPIATVEGQPIYTEDLMTAGDRLFDLRNQEYKVKSDALDTLIRKRLIEAEAKKKGVSVEELLKQEVDAKIPEPSDDVARGYFLAAQNQSTLSFDALKAQVKQFVRNAEIQQARKKYEDWLRARAEISILLRPPSVQLAYDAARVEGNPNAPVTIVEFADFQCPFCKGTEGILKALLAKYRGRVKVAFLDFPLSEIHGQAEKAAEAARCAGEQGKFWEYHDSLFAEQSKLDEANLIGRAQNLHLDESAFRSCLASGKFQHDVLANREEGSKAGVTGTPAWFINGIYLNGAQPQAEFEKIIDGELAAHPGVQGAAR
jgi:protein-disulfide isomerase